MADRATAGRVPVRMQTLVLVLLAIAVALAGCSAVFGSEEELPSGETAKENYLSLDGYTATAEIEQGDGTDYRMRVFVDPDGSNSRAEYLAPDRVAGNVNLLNGSTIVRYNATRNEYVRISTTRDDRFEAGAQRIKQAVENAREDGETTVDSPGAGGAPLPVVPSEDDAGSEDGQFVVSYDGTESILGREAHVLTYEAAGDRSEGVLSRKVWLDSEYFVTLKSTQVARFDGERSTYTFRLTNVTFEPGLDASRFQFDPPKGATLNESESYDVQTYDSRPALVEETDIAVPDPTVPDRFSLQRAAHIRGQNFTAVQLQFRQGTSRLVVTKTTEQSYTDLTDGEPVEIGAETGRFRSSGAQGLVVWECGGYVRTVVGDAGKSTLVDVARSVGCR